MLKIESISLGVSAIVLFVSLGNNIRISSIVNALEDAGHLNTHLYSDIIEKQDCVEKTQPNTLGLTTPVSKCVVHDIFSEQKGREVNNKNSDTEVTQEVINLSASNYPAVAFKQAEGFIDQLEKKSIDAEQFKQQFQQRLSVLDNDDVVRIMKVYAKKLESGRLPSDPLYSSNN